MPNPQLTHHLVSPDSYASTLVIAVLDEYGVEALEWDPRTLLAELQDDFRVQIPEQCFDRLCAGIQLVTTDKMYKSLPDFVQLCPILSGHGRSGDLDFPDALECGWGITEAMLLGPPEDGDTEPFTDEICSFLGHILQEEGIQHPKGVLRIARLPRQPAESAADDFSDDPAMFSAVYETSNRKGQDIDDRLKTSLIELMLQLSSLPLTNGDASKLAQRFRPASTAGR